MLKKFSQSPSIWTNYAAFLFDTISDAARARLLLSRALHALPPYTHVEITSKFASLEFRSQSGDAERGRTIFEGLLESFPKRIDLWNVLLDLEIKLAADGDKAAVRRLFERVTSSSAVKKKRKTAKFFFKRWLDWEEKDAGGDERKVEAVKKKAAEYVRTAEQNR